MRVVHIQYMEISERIWEVYWLECPLILSEAVSSLKSPCSLYNFCVIFQSFAFCFNDVFMEAMKCILMDSN